ncbi:MAG: glycosyltransferase family 2 protein [Acidobacteriota bacterium]|nr:glycosyltransferase family 2 protein [Acidobacteriota bacterium]
MKVSIVTISFNQVGFLNHAIRSVLEQDYPEIEYIVVDPGSTDGSRALIAGYADQVRTVLKPDQGPADGLNRGFALATGDIFAFLNSDDILLPGAVRRAVEHLKSGGCDVVSGHALVIDAEGKTLRKVFSEPYSLKRYAYGTSILIQPSTFFTREIFEKSGGFNVNNRATWDGELFMEMALKGARFQLADEVWSGFRLHDTSITGTGKLDGYILGFHKEAFRRIMGREEKGRDKLLKYWFRLERWLRNPRSFWERMLRGPMHRRFEE